MEFPIVIREFSLIEISEVAMLRLVDLVGFR